MPSMSQFVPFYVSGLSGFVCASLVGLVAAAVLMPKDLLTRKEPVLETDSPPLVKLPTKAKVNEFRLTLERNIFNHGISALEETDSKPICDLKKSELPLKFTGVIFGGTKETSLVLLEATSNKQADSFLLGELVPGDARIIDIERRKVTFERAGCPEFLELDEPELPKKRVAGAKPKTPLKTDAALSGDGFKEDGFERAGGEIKVTRQWIDKSLTVDFTKTLQDAKASPNIVGNEVKGFVLTRIKPDSVYEKMGLQDGDVVENINGIDLNDAPRAIQTLNAVRNESNIELQIKRNGQTLPMRIQVK
jgi:general secretion pathway protein C